MGTGASSLEEKDIDEEGNVVSEVVCTRQYTAENSKDLPELAMVVQGGNQSGLTLFVRQLLRSADEPQFRFPLSDAEVEKMDSGQTRKLLFEVLRCGRLANGTRTGSDWLTGVTQQNYLFLEYNYPLFLGADKGAKFVRENKSKILEALASLRDDEKFIRAFRANPHLLPPGLLEVMQNPESVFSGSRVKQSTRLKAENLVIGGWKQVNLPNTKAAAAWIMKDPASSGDGWISVIEGKTPVQISDFTSQKFRGFVWLCSLMDFYSSSYVPLNVVKEFVKNIKQTLNNQRSSHGFVVFTFKDKFLKEFDPQRQYKIPYISSTSAEGVLSQFEDYFKTQISEDLLPRFHLLTVNCQSLDEMKLLREFILASMMSSGSSGEINEAMDQPGVSVVDGPPTDRVVRFERSLT